MSKKRIMVKMRVNLHVLVIGFFSLCSFGEDYSEEYLQEYMLTNLEKWCPDAWCSGDFNYIWEKFSYNSKKHQWELEFVSYPRFNKNFSFVNEGVSYLGTIKSGEIPALRSLCTFPAVEPIDVFKVKNQQLTGMSKSMRSWLLSCTLALEQSFIKITS